jgi:5-methylcytosine-specific restriction endonuclease McrA
MSYKAKRIHIGDIKNKDKYLELHPRCERCGSTFLLAVHHRIPQQYTIYGQGFVLEMPINYTALCGVCHTDLEKKLNTLKDGSKPEEHVLAWIKEQPEDWFYITTLAKIKEIIECELEEEHGCIERVIEEGE